MYCSLSCMSNMSDRLQIKTMKHITIYIVYFIHVEAVKTFQVILCT